MHYLKQAMCLPWPPRCAHASWWKGSRDTKAWCRFVQQLFATSAANIRCTWLLLMRPWWGLHLTFSLATEAGAGQGDGVQPPLLPGGLQLPRVPSPSMATAVALLAGASLSIHLAHAAWSQRRWRRQAVIASALTADFWEQRPAALEASGEDSFLSAALATALVAESHRSTSRGSSTQTGTGSEVDRPMVPSPFAMQRKLSMIKSASAPRDLLQHGGAVATWDPAGNDILHGRAGQDGVGGSGSGSAGRGNEADAAVICSRLKDLQESATSAPRTALQLLEVLLLVLSLLDGVTDPAAASLHQLASVWDVASVDLQFHMTLVAGRSSMTAVRATGMCRTAVWSTCITPMQHCERCHVGPFSSRLSLRQRHGAGCVVWGGGGCSLGRRHAADLRERSL